MYFDGDSYEYVATFWRGTGPSTGHYYLEKEVFVCFKALLCVSPAWQSWRLASPFRTWSLLVGA